jgi:hypothetical protein
VASGLTILKDQHALAEIAKRRRVLRLPYSARQVLEQSLKVACSAKKSRAWTLPESLLSEEVLHYRERDRHLKVRGPLPHLRSSIVPEIAEELSIKVNVALDFAQLAATAVPLIRPILLYYACAHLCGVYTRFLFTWKRDSFLHGLACSMDKSAVGKTSIRVEKGQFPRLAITCFLLSGQPSCFTPLVTYSERPTDHTADGGLLESFGKVEIGKPPGSFTLEELVGFDFAARLELVQRLHGFHKFKGLPSTAFLLDVITLFTASWLARYDVRGWNEILEGRKNDFRVHFEETFDRCGDRSEIGLNLPI